MKRLLLLLALTACGGKSASPADGTEQKTFSNYPVEEPPTNQDGGGSKTTDDAGNTVVVINSEEELAGCYGNDHPPINFSAKTLIVAYGSTANGVAEEIVESFDRLSGGGYELNVEITQNDATVAEGWCVGITVDKIDSQSSIKLNLKLI